jgi:hypothetical protein
MIVHVPTRTPCRKRWMRNQRLGRIGELEDTLKQRDARIKELKAEVDEQRLLVEEMRQQVIDGNELIDSWIEGFGMVLNDDGKYEWEQPLIEEAEKIVDEYNELLSKWNKFVPRYNAVIAPRGHGRPLAASEAQEREVLKLHRQRYSLREIVEETGLGIRTVRTVIGKADGTDRTSIKEDKLRRLVLNRDKQATWRARKRVRDGLPKRINVVLKKGGELVKKAGVSRVR